MKKYLSIFLFSLYLFSSTDIKELFKMNALVQHFHETQQIDHSVSFLHYLVMHYITDDLNDKDNDRDMQLPFKSPDVCIAHSALVFIPNPFASFTLQPLPVNERAFLTVDVPFVASDFDSSVWHPPQFS